MEYLKLKKGIKIAVHKVIHVHVAIDILLLGH